MDDKVHACLVRLVIPFFTLDYYNHCYMVGITGVKLKNVTFLTLGRRFRYQTGMEWQAYALIDSHPHVWPMVKVHPPVS